MIYTGFEIVFRKDDPEVTVQVTVDGKLVDPTKIVCVYRSDAVSFWTWLWHWLTRQQKILHDERVMSYQFTEPLDALGFHPILKLSAEETGRQFHLYSLKWKGRVPLPQYTNASIRDED